jgi:hypothetical protein
MDQDILNLIAIGIVAYATGRLIARYLLPVLDAIYMVYKNNRKFNKLEKEKERILKENGGVHQWIELKSPSGGKMLVCEKTGWCPSRESFLPASAIEALRKTDQLEQEYINYKKQKNAEIEQMYGLKEGDAEEIYNKVSDMRKQYSLQKLSSFLKELKNDEK